MSTGPTDAVRCDLLDLATRRFIHKREFLIRPLRTSHLRKPLRAPGKRPYNQLMAKRGKISDGLESLMAGIRARYSQIRKGSDQEEAFLLHLRSLSQWNRDSMDYPNVDPEFLELIHVAYAVCHPHCGVREFIIEGSTQECQHCGGLLFRTATREYVRKQAD